MKKNLFLGVLFLILMAFSVSASLDLTANPGTIHVTDLTQSTNGIVTFTNTEATSDYEVVAVQAVGPLSSYITLGLVGTIENGTYKNMSVTINPLHFNVEAGTHFVDIEYAYTKDGADQKVATFTLPVEIIEVTDFDFTVNPSSVTMNTGEIGEFEVFIENTGNVGLSGIVITDTLDLGVVYAPVNSELGFGESRTYTGTIPISFSASEKTGDVNIKTDVTLTEKKSITVTVVEPVVIAPDVVFTSVPSFDFAPGENYTREITISNPGTSAATGLSVTVSSIADFTILSTIDKVTIDADGTAKILLEISVPKEINQKTNYATTVTVTGDDISSAKKINFNFAGKLEFNDVEFDIEFPRSEDDTDDDDGDIDEGDTITVGEGSVVEITGDVENMFNDEIDIDSVKVYLEIDRMDDGSDYDERESLGSISDGKDESFIFTFTVPYDEFDDGDTATAILYVEGEDDNNVNHYAEINFDFEIEKDNEEVTITEAYLSQDTVTCQDEITLYVEVKNTGEDDLEDDESVDLTVEVDDIDFGKAIRNVDMESDDRDDSNEIMYTFNLDVSSLKASSKSHAIKIIAYADDDESDRQTISFVVGKCNAVIDNGGSNTGSNTGATTSTDSTDTDSQTDNDLSTGQTAGLPYAQYVNLDTKSDSFRDSDGYLILIGVLFILVLVLVLVLAVSLVGKKK